MNSVPHRLGFVSAVCLVSLVSCGKSNDLRPGARADAKARPVRVARAEARPLERTITVTGNLAPREQSTLSAKLTGRLQSLAVDIGSSVRPGDVIAQIEPRDYELRVQQAAASLSQARAALGLPLEGHDDQVTLEQISAVKEAKAVLEEAGKNRERISTLSKAGIASASEFDTVDASYRVASTRYDAALDESRTRQAALAQRRAEYEIARKQLTDAAVRAPFEGVVQARLARAGEYVAAGTPIVTLVKIDPLRLRLDVPERDSVALRSNQVVRVSIDGDTNLYSGRLTRLSPAIDDRSRMLLVEADVSSQGLLRPGLFARAEIIVNEQESGLTVPRNALITFAGLEKVIVVKESKALEKIVSTGRHGPGWVEITAGIALDEWVVLDPGGLRTGQAVNVAAPPENPSSAKAGTESGP